jgi:sensor histidine kinase YesM
MNSLRADTGIRSPKSLSAGVFSGALMNNGFKTRKLAGQFSKPVQRTILLPLMHSTDQVMIKKIFGKVILRLPLFLLISFPLKILLDLIFGLIYRNYWIIRPIEEYLGAAILTIVTLETVLFIKRRLSKNFPWEKNPTRRLLVEIAINSVMLSIIIALLSLGIKYFIVKSPFIQLSDEVLTTLYYIILLVYVPAFAEFAVFLLNRWRTSLAEMEKYKKENAEYRFETLRTQVNPHFLFNSLNTLSSLMYEDREKAAGFIRDLSDVYRYVLENRSRETIPLREEVKFIRSFVYLYQLRFDNKLNVEIDIAESFQDKQIAPMTLQLLVENAVKHNIVSVKKPLGISVTANENGYLTVRNNLQKKPAEMASSEIGLKNITSRYAYLTDKPVEVSETESEFIVRVPLI